MASLKFNPDSFTELRKDCYYIFSSEGQLEFPTIEDLEDYLQSFCDSLGKSLSELPPFEVFRVQMFVQPKND